jgi:hypothetical protein
MGGRVKVQLSQSGCLLRGIRAIGGLMIAAGIVVIVIGWHDRPLAIKGAIAVLTGEATQVAARALAWLLHGE